MNAVFLFFLIGGIAAALLSGNGGSVLDALLSGTKAAVDNAVRLLGVYLFWMGLMNVAQQAGLMRALSRLLGPALRLLFPNAGEAGEAISMNLAANMLGMGNAATPYGLSAMRLLNEANPRPGVATNEMCVLIAINASCLELFPATLVGLRQSFGSAAPYAAVLPTLLSSLCATLVAAALCLLCIRPCRSQS